MPRLDRGERRHWRAYLEPATVILAGVLAVVVFGVFLHSRANDDDRRQPAPVVAITPETTEQVPIPLPSASESPSFAPVDGISLERVAVDSTVDLSAEGTVDWVHWGEQGRFSLERDADGGFAILEGTPALPRTRHTASPQRFTWTGGAPLAEASGVTSGISTCGAGNGFTLSAPAGPGRHTLILYVGVAAARGSLTIELSTDPEKTFTDLWEIRGRTMATTAYVISYQASRTGKISVKWITDASFDQKCGGVALQAATLS